MVVSELQAPALLVAVPQMVEPGFSNSVILILEHGSEGSMGLVLNQMTDLDVDEFCKSQDMRYTGPAGEMVCQGGPVQTDRAFILHSGEKKGPETEDVIDGVRFSYSMESLKIVTEAKPDDFRVFLGYAGWGPHQLADEMATGAWLLTPANRQLIFETEPKLLWDSTLRQMGIEPGLLMHCGMVN